MTNVLYQVSSRAIKDRRFPSRLHPLNDIHMKPTIFILDPCIKGTAHNDRGGVKGRYLISSYKI